MAKTLQKAKVKRLSFNPLSVSEKYDQIFSIIIDLVATIAMHIYYIKMYVVLYFYNSL